jgi:type IV pilus biogenesis protein PilP
MDQMRSDESTTPSPALKGDMLGLAGDAPTPRKKTGVVFAAVAVLVLFAFAAAAAVYTFVLAVPDNSETLLTQEVTQESPPPALADADATEPPPVPLNRVFTFRDVFAPLIQPAPEAATVAPPVTGSTTTTGTAAANDGTLTLQDVISVDGEPAAVLLLDGQTYTVGAGESIPGTPWKVMSISGQTVQLQYGDVPVTLSVGQGITPSTK